MNLPKGRRSAAAFTLIELLIVVSVITLLIGLLLPALSRARQSASKAQCLSNIRQLETAQVAYASGNEDLILAAGDGTAQGSWMGALESYGTTPSARKCPSDRSPYYAQPIPGSSPPRLRTTSYGVNNYVSPTHAPFGVEPVRYLTQVAQSSSVIHLGELTETGTYAGSDHFHVQEFYNALAPPITIALIDVQMCLGRHGGKAKSWDATLTFSFLDGHAETLSIRRVYTNPTVNLFIPTFVKRAMSQGH